MLKKVTAGFVIQEFDPDLKKFVSQEFVCGDEVTYEDTDADEETEPNEGNPELQDRFVNNEGTEPYLPYLMYQPGELDNKLICTLVEHRACRSSSKENNHGEIPGQKFWTDSEIGECN